MDAHYVIDPATASVLFDVPFTSDVCTAPHKVAFTDDYKFKPDPVIFYEVQKDGEYLLSIYDSIYRGREDFVYRITAGELPFVTSIFPLGGRAGEQTPLALEGGNLPVDGGVLEAFPR